MFSHILEDLKPFLDSIKIPSDNVYNLRDSARALFVSLLIKRYPAKRHILICATDEEALAIRRGIEFYMELISGNASSSRVYILPPPYDTSSTGERLRIISAFEKGDLMIGTSEALFSVTWDMAELKRERLFLRTKERIQRERFVEALQRLGYKRTAIVSSPGEFTVRRWVFDIFPSDGSVPVRVELFGDEIEEIKEFDVETQRSIRRLQEITVLPSFEKSDGPRVIDLFASVSILYASTEMQQKTGDIECIRLCSFSRHPESEPGFQPLTGLGLTCHERRDIHELIPAVNALSNYRFLFVMATDAQARRLRELFSEGGIDAPIMEPSSVMLFRGRIAITTGRLSSGLHIKDLIILTPEDVFGRGPSYRTVQVSKIKRLVDEIDELKEGDYVVHEQHGIGVYRGLVPLQTDSHRGESLCIEYAQGARLYLPLQRISLIKKYKAEEGVIPAIDTLGGRTWKRKTERARKKIREVAERLLKLYARRELSEGYPFSADTELHREFESFFPFEETPDQLKAWQEIKEEMESKRPMDRLLCGDVGFGKTEIAMRAAFKAVFDGKQVAVLVPTTILCEQHYRNFVARFSAFPVRVDFLSRFKTTGEIKKTLQGLRTGEIDIIIGTHALLGRNVKFFDLGLLVIDEEHRFGVSHKERIKELKTGVDCLTLSATPIPRTLEMSLSGIRPMSLIETPPEERLSVKGIVTVFNDETIRTAILKEVQRGGQVFFVHNRVSELPSIHDYLKRLVPEVTVMVAHGQMRSGELEDVMLSFMDGRADLLLCTSIIGSGIDIPRANTIIINRADRIGLADLYQLKGRVGRSNVKAYCYFLIPPEDMLSDEARRRIKAIEELNFLGAGLRLALKDLEIRGAGNLLGREQSGHIHAVGFDRYIEMLKEEVARLKGEYVERRPEPSIDLDIEAYLPEHFIPDTGLRLSMYRRLSMVESEDELLSLKEEMEDRFGALPEEVEALIGVVNIRILAKGLGILSVKQQRGGVSVRVDGTFSLGPEEIMKVAGDIGLEIRFRGDGFLLTSGDNARVDRVEGILRMLKTMAG